jgi:DNA mismatch repair ATPase MutS
MGARLLRASIVQPLQSPALINSRLDAVDEIINNSALYFVSST